MDWQAYDAHSREVESAIGVIRRRLRASAGEMDDFAQDARVFVARHSRAIFPAFRGRSSLTTYLTKVLWHYWIRWYRAKADPTTRGEASSCRSLRDPLQNEQESGRLFECCLAGQCFEHEVRLWIRQLSEQERTLIHRRFVLGEQMADIARELQTTPTAAFKRTYRLVGTLRRRLAAAGITAHESSDIQVWLRSTDNDLFACCRNPARNDITRLPRRCVRSDTSRTQNGSVLG